TRREKISIGRSMGTVSTRRPAGPRRRTADDGRASARSSASSGNLSNAPGVTPPPQGFSRGCDGSKTTTRCPALASRQAQNEPGGPALTTATSITSHVRVVGAVAALGGRPGDDGVGIGDVARLAVHAVLVVDHEALLPGPGVVGDHLVHRRRTEALAGI